MINIQPGSINQTIDIVVINSTTGLGLTGLVYNTANLSCYYRRGATGSFTQLSLATQTVGGAHSDGGFVELDSTNAPGTYRLDLADAIVAAGVEYVTIYLHGAANMLPVAARIYLEDKVAVTDLVTNGPITTDGSGNISGTVGGVAGNITGDVEGTCTGIVSLLNVTGRSQLTDVITASDSPLAKIDAIHQALLNPKVTDGGDGVDGTHTIYLADGTTPWLSRSINKTGDIVTIGSLDTP